MRYKDRGSIGEPEQRRSRGWEAEPGSRRGPRSEDHRPHGHRGGGREGRRGGPAGPGAPFGRGRGRAQRGDVRTAILLLLADQPMADGVLIVAGPTGGRINTGIGIFEAPDEETARRIIGEDPVARGGFATPELRPYQVGFLRGRQ